MFKQAAFIYIDEDGSIRETANKAAREYEVIVACGGDGTIKETANALIHTNVILGVLPIGSGNDFAKSIGLSTDFRKNLEILRSCKTSGIDVIQYGEGQYFLNTMGFGLDGRTNYYAAILNKWTGKLRYFLGGIYAMIKADRFTYKCSTNKNHIEGSSWMVVAANGAVEGGKYRISPDSCNSDGIFEIIIVKPISRLRLILEFLKLSMGFSFSKQVIYQVTTKECSLSLDQKLHIHADGEIVKQKSFSIDFKLLKNSLTVIKA